MPEARINFTDPDSRVVKRLRGFLQGCNALAATDEHQVVLAAEIETVGADCGHLEPMLDATERELAAAAIDEPPPPSHAPQPGRRPLRPDASGAADAAPTAPRSD